MGAIDLTNRTICVPLSARNVPVTCNIGMCGGHHVPSQSLSQVIIDGGIRPSRVFRIIPTKRTTGQPLAVEVVSHVMETNPSIKIRDELDVP
jgi:hypothetical protein